jgi:ankyrin repeat protein
VKNSQPTRRLRQRPDLDQLKRQAKELLQAFVAREASAVAEVDAYYQDADATKFALHDAQLVLARSYGFDSWPKLKAYVDGATVKRLANAVCACDVTKVRAMLKTRPELVRMHMAGNDERRALHYAVLNRAPEMVRVLMEHGADARKGIYPHRDATGALTIALERGYDEIVAIIREYEDQRHERLGGGRGNIRGESQAWVQTGSHTAPLPTSDILSEAIACSDAARAVAMMGPDGVLINALNRDGWAPLHIAAAMLNEFMVTWLLERGADVSRRGPSDRTPLDMAAVSRRVRNGDKRQFGTVAQALRRHGAELTARSAVALGESDWLRAQHSEGALVNPIEDWGGLLTVAVMHDRPEMLTLLLDLGFDPDERMRVEGLEDATFSWGMPLWNCAGQGKHTMAEMLLSHGADPNGRVYASGSPMFQAYSQGDWTMVELLKRYDGATEATTAGLFRQTELARQMLAREVVASLEEGIFAGQTVAEQLLWGAACGGDPEIVRMALERVDWPPDDPRWYTILEQPLRFWSYGVTKPLDRQTYLACFSLVLERCSPNISGRFGLTILHDVAGSREHVTPGERAALATMLLDAGARMDARDDLLKSTPLGWACRWGRIELVKLLIERGADPIEADAEPWATPRAWAEKKGDESLLSLLREHT